MSFEKDVNKKMLTKILTKATIPNNINESNILNELFSCLDEQLLTDKSIFF